MDPVGVNAASGPAPGPLSVAIVGAGPAGCALGILLAREGVCVTLFDDGRRPELVVGESLVPAVVPILRRLGMEQEVAPWSSLKPGVSFIWSPDIRVSVNFKRFAPAVFPYAYNIPRPRFDEAMLAKAVAAGVHHVPARARLQRPDAAAAGADVVLAPETVAAAPALGGRPPHLVVDATGRARQVAHTLAIPARTGPRRDVAHFAHFEGFRWDDAAGQVVIARAQAGWSWCIPLQERLSIGIVLGQDAAARLGRLPEERLDRAIRTDPWLSRVAGAARRVTDVATYGNYQLISERGHGRGWVMLGDAFGFVDPMLSPGVFLALRSAELLADRLAPWLRRRAAPSAAELDVALASYGDRQREMLAAWFELVAYLYDGRLGALMRAGQLWKQSSPRFLSDLAEGYIGRRVGLLASGAATTSRYSRSFLRFMSRHALLGVDPKEFAIR
jgi:flavin-dependent dehydrogenase